MKFKLALASFFLTLIFVSGLGLNQIRQANSNTELSLLPKQNPSSSLQALPATAERFAQKIN